MTWTKVANVGAVKTGRKCCSTATKESVTSMGRLPCHGATWGVVDQPKLPKPGEEAAYFCAGGRRKGPPKSAKLELRSGPLFPPVSVPAAPRQEGESAKLKGRPVPIARPT